MFSPEGPTFVELVRQALSSTQRGYDLLAPKFDHTPFRTPEPIVAAVCAHVPPGTRNAIDLCCGTGAGLEGLVERCDDVTGVDFSAGMLEVARDRVPAAQLLERDVFSLRDRAAFDVVTCFGAFGHIEERDEPRFAELVHRLLRPGGRFVFATASMPPRWSKGRILSRGFNAAMRLRNAVIRPAFVMYYLTFMLPECRRLLEQQGFEVTVHAPGLPAPLSAVRIVVATRKSTP